MLIWDLATCRSEGRAAQDAQPLQHPILLAAFLLMIKQGSATRQLVPKKQNLLRVGKHQTDCRVRHHISLGTDPPPNAIPC